MENFYLDQGLSEQPEVKIYDVDCLFRPTTITRYQNIKN